MYSCGTWVRRGIRVAYLVLAVIGFLTVVIKLYNCMAGNPDDPIIIIQCNCSIPKWHKKKIRTAPWYSLYLTHLRKVDLSFTSYARREINCARWWHPTPHLVYTEQPDRGIGWKPNIKPPNYKRPNCTFGQKLVPKTKCGNQMEQLWRRLEEIGVLYYPRDGSEVGIVRGSSYLTSDGDMDVFVDMPQEMLYKALLPALSPKPYLSGTGVGRGVHWKIKGCPIVHIHFSDWTGVERGKKATHMDTCSCMLNSVPIACHKEGLSRLYTEYGPSWRVPLHSKHLDCPVTTYTFKKNSVKKLRALVSSSGLIEENNIRELDKTIQYSTEEMNLILAHLNIIQSRIEEKIEYKGVKC